MTPPDTAAPGPGLRQLRDAIREDLGRVERLRAVGRRRPEIDALLADLDAQLDRAEAAAVITLVGPTGGGKSTMLNALVGRSLAAEGVDRPTTRRPTVYAPAEADIGPLLAAAAAAAPGLAAGDAVTVCRHAAGSPAAAHVLVDAPDLNSVDATHRAVVTALAAHSDVLVAVLHHQAVVETATLSFLEQFAGRRHMLFVLNRTDELTPEARGDLLAQLHAVVTARLGLPAPAIFALSARAARGPVPPHEWLAFRAALLDLTRTPAARSVKRLNALGTASRLGAVFAEVRATVEADLAALAPETARALGELAQHVADDVARRLDACRADLADLLVAEVTRRWNGPGGWALGLGTRTALALAAAGALVRRHPLGAAATALGALVAGELATAYGRERTAGAAATATADIEARHAVALAPVRLRAARLTGDPGGFALPSAAAIADAAGRAAAGSWSRLVELELPERAARRVLVPLRLILDLPAWSLGAWLLYRVAHGLVVGVPAGVDFLLGGGILLAAYLAILRMAGRSLAARSAGRLLGRAARRVRATLEEEGARLQAATGHEVAEVRAALDRLCALPDPWRHGALSAAAPFED